MIIVLSQKFLKHFQEQQEPASIVAAGERFGKQFKMFHTVKSTCAFQGASSQRALRKHADPKIRDPPIQGGLLNLENKMFIYSGRWSLLALKGGCLMVSTECVQFDTPVSRTSRQSAAEFASMPNIKLRYFRCLMCGRKSAACVGMLPVNMPFVTEVPCNTLRVVPVD